MKKTLYVLTCALCTLFVLPAAAQVPSYVPTDGLVGWWPFNGNANDESGNGNDGVVNGATLTEDRFGNINAAYFFDGGSSSISIPHSNSLAIIGDITISVWKKSFGNTGNYETFVNKRGGNGEWNYNLGASHAFGPGGCPQEVDKYVTGRRNNGGSQYELRFSDYLVSNDIDEWTNIILAITSNTIQFYVNGNLVGNSCFGDSFSIPSIDVGAPLTMGSCNCGLAEFFHGDLDDIAIYNRALTAQEIQNLYTGTTPPPCVSLPSNLQQGLVGYWPFCGKANDESGNGNNGVVNGATLTEDRFGNAVSAYSFNRIIENEIDINNSESLDSIRSVTISLWVNLMSYGENNQAGYNHFINKSDQSNNHQFIFANNSSQMYFYFGNDNNAFWTDHLPELNQWSNLIVTYDFDGTSENSLCRFYINGDMVDSMVTTQQLTPSTHDLRIGTFGTASYNRVDGTLDDIGIWNRALTPEEVQELYTLDACTFTVYDTLTVYETVYDTVYTYETIYDTVTTYVTVTDTLLIDITFTGFEGQPSWLNTVTVFPNPASDHITIDYGNFALMAGYNTIITDAAGATVYSSAVNSQQVEIDINAWGATGVYYMSVYDASGELVAVRHIVLE